MSEDNQDEYKDYGLNNLLKAFKEIPQARVGILEGSAPRKDGSLSNADIGKKHEFGEDGMPMRSFLRVPIADNLQKIGEAAGLFDQENMNEVAKTGSLLDITKKIGVLGEGIVLEGFASGGFGKWKPSNMEHKKNKETLVESTQLRDSITSDVKE